MKLSQIRWIVFGIGLILLGIIVYVGIFREFDAKGYVDAVLAQYLKGDMTLAEEVFEDTESQVLKEQYESSIRSFVESNITSGIEMDEERKAAYVDLCKTIFSNFTYEVQEAEKIDRSQYQVPVTYHPVNLFELFQEGLAAEQARLSQKVEKGEYQGSVEEIKQQMQEEFYTNAYQLFEEAYKNVEEGAQETYVFSVVKNENGDFEVEESQITEFIAKIVNIDEIQG